ncbi:MAG: septum formation protein Maf, partial [Gemmatimonadetes bacterium]|nr:septum formation protein Maf [Gemmatimonadota bacterium]
MRNTLLYLTGHGLGLVSQSPRRAEILRAAGIPFQVIRSRETEETSDVVDIPARAIDIAAKKCAGAITKDDTPAILVGADTMVVRDGNVLGKPRDEDDARRMLHSLSGREHDVMTGLAVRHRSGDFRATACEITRVTFRQLDAGEIDDYIATGEPWDKAGAYGIQGRGGLFVEGVQG